MRSIDLATLEWPTVTMLNPASALWPVPFIAAGFALYRLIMDKLLGAKATRLANAKINQSEPAWLAQALKDAGADSTNAMTVCSNMKLETLTELFDQHNVTLDARQTRKLKSYHKLANEYETQRQKFMESVWKLTIVVSLHALGFYVNIIKNDFFVHHQRQWPECPEEPCRQEQDGYLLTYYIVSLGYHVQRTLSQFHNPSRKDFWALLIHHWSTIILITFSYFAAFLRSGSMVLFIHENSDVFLESAKLCVYMGDDSIVRPLADPFFFMFVMSWIGFRFGCFGYKVLWEIIRFGSSQLWIGNSPLFFNWFCVILLFVLMGLHVWWWSLLWVMIKRKLGGQTLKDIRSE